MADDKPFNLIDGATGDASAVVREVEDQRRISSDPNLPLEQRLEAYEDIFDSEVGDTADVRITSVDIQEPNLETVFLHLTGRALRD